MNEWVALGLGIGFFTALVRRLARRLRGLDTGDTMEVEGESC